VESIEELTARCIAYEVPACSIDAHISHDGSCVEHDDWPSAHQCSRLIEAWRYREGNPYADVHKEWERRQDDCVEKTRIGSAARDACQQAVARWYNTSEAALYGERRGIAYKRCQKRCDDLQKEYTQEDCPNKASTVLEECRKKAIEEYEENCYEKYSWLSLSQEEQRRTDFNKFQTAGECLKKQGAQQNAAIRACILASEDLPPVCRPVPKIMCTSWNYIGPISLEELPPVCRSVLN
jgi:hypothetical protein